MDSEALKPCPFCGCAFPAVGYDGDAKTLGRKECITARCRQCGGETRKFSSQAEAITAWNTRADDDRIEALQAEKAKLRGLVATLWCASGCSCCRDDKTWEKVSAELAEIFGVRKYDDGIGYDWYSLDEAALYRRQNDDRD